MNPNQQVNWSSRLTFLLAAIGSAVGLANIWRFPFTVGVSGGGAFVLIYLGAALLLALPLVIAELMLGRRGAAPPPRAIATVAVESGHSPRWGMMGVILGCFGGVLALSFYAVVGGWTMAYVVEIARGGLQGVNTEQAQAIFAGLNANPWALLTWFSIFIVATVAVSAGGIRAGVERAVKFMMPALLLMLIMMLLYAVKVGQFGLALEFLFKPDFSQINASIVMAAFGQAFFSVSVGLTSLTAYGAYIDRKTSIPRSAAIIVAADTSVALLAGLAIFPIIFAFGLQPDAGPGLVFITLPFAFSQMPGGQFFGGLFFLLLLFAALTSSIAMIEAAVSWLSDRTRLSRAGAAITAGAVSWTLGLFAVLSMNLLSDFHPLGAIPVFAGKTFFDLYDFLVINIMMPLGGIMIAIFCGWLMLRKFSRQELYGGKDTAGYRIWLTLIRWFVPLVLAAVFVDMLIQSTA